MTISGFQPIQNQNISVQKGPLMLKQGQVVHGTVKQLYPDQLAEIQIGEHRLIAKLETPLKVGDSHFFQVSNMNPDPQLKVVSGPSGQANNVQQLMESLNLPKSQEMLQILSHFMKEDLPILKEQMVQAEMWIKNLQEGITKQEAIAALQKLVELKIPFTQESFKALLFGAKTTGIANDLQQLMTLLQQNQEISPQIKGNLLNQLQTIANPFEAETAGIAISRAIQTLLSTGEQEENKQQALNILKEVNILPKEATLKNWLNVSFHQLAARNETAGHMISQLRTNGQIEQAINWVKHEPILHNEQKNVIIQMLTSFDGSKNSQSMELLARQLHVQLLKAYADQGITIQFSNENRYQAKDHLLTLLKPNIGNTSLELRNIWKQLNVSEQLATQKFVAEANALIQSSLNSKGMLEGIQTVLKSLGMSFEAQLKNQVDGEEIAQALKPQLLSLLQDSNASAEVKSTAETLLARLNGMQLLSGENGPQHQIIMQIPVQFLGKQVDATVQWNGRMKENGKIDSNYARVLFYLNMQALKETIVDMQVQNRIVTIHVYNEHQNLEFLAEPLKKLLKSGLEEKNYYLSGVIIKPIEKSVAAKGKGIKKSQSIEVKNQVKKGVDIRI